MSPNFADSGQRLVSPFSTRGTLSGGLPQGDLLKRGVKNIWLESPARPAPLGSELSMIPRYTRPEMAAIWEAQTRFKIWFEIEAHAADALAELGVIPKEAAKTIWAKGKNATFDVARIDEIERETKHDVIAFLTHLAEIVGPDARFVHQGMTSSDVLDTCLNVQLVRAADILVEDIDRVLAALKKRAFEHKMTPTVGRSHGIHAEPVTFGLKLAYAYAEFSRARERLKLARKEVATCAISGAVGTFAQIDPRVEEHVAKAMGLTPEPVSTQVIPRDRHAMYFATLGVIASSVERLATEIRHLQRTEVLEAEEFFSEGQKGSSAMPHKRNPVLSENLTGLSRMVRAYVTPALENVVLWHERDISHSSAERMIGPDATVTLDFALNRLAGLIDKLLIYPANMQKNLDRLGGLIHSQRLLIALTQKGASREDSYRLVQRNAMPVWRGEGDFQALLKKDPDVKRYLSDAEIDEQFDLGYHFKHVDTIFKRVFGET
jgi:adenylosuccinate lyase